MAQRMRCIAGETFVCCKLPTCRFPFLRKGQKQDLLYVIFSMLKKTVSEKDEITFLRMYGLTDKTINGYI